jgi:hypothetical protein
LDKGRFNKIMALTKKYSTKVKIRTYSKSRLVDKAPKERYSLREDFNRMVFDNVKNVNIRSSLRALNSSHEVRRSRISKKFNLNGGRKGSLGDKLKFESGLRRIQSEKLVAKGLGTIPQI